MTHLFEYDAAAGILQSRMEGRVTSEELADSTILPPGVDDVCVFPNGSQPAITGNELRTRRQRKNARLRR